MNKWYESWHSIKELFFTDRLFLVLKVRHPAFDIMGNSAMHARSIHGQLKWP